MRGSIDKHPCFINGTTSGQTSLKGQRRAKIDFNARQKMSEKRKEKIALHSNGLPTTLQSGIKKTLPKALRTKSSVSGVIVD